MKKILLSLFLATMFFATFAQVRQPATQIPKGNLENLSEINQEIIWETNTPKDCFCCDEKVYNLPQKPPISGPQSVSCGTKAIFNTIPCKGATITWTVSPSIPGTSGANSPTFIVPDNALPEIT